MTGIRKIGDCYYRCATGKQALGGPRGPNLEGVRQRQKSGWFFATSWQSRYKHPRRRVVPAWGDFREFSTASRQFACVSEIFRRLRGRSNIATRMMSRMRVMRMTRMTSLARNDGGTSGQSEPPLFKRATCELHGGPVDGGGSRDIPMIVPGLPPDYLEIALAGHGESDAIAVYRRVASRPSLRTARGKVWRYEYDEEATLDPGCIGTR